jgi:hypothetical protein
LDETSNSYSKYAVENSFLLFWNWTTHWCFKIMLLSTNLLKKKKLWGHIQGKREQAETERNLKCTVS